MGRPRNYSADPLGHLKRQVGLIQAHMSSGGSATLRVEEMRQLSMGFTTSHWHFGQVGLGTGLPFNGEAQCGTFRAWGRLGDPLVRGRVSLHLFRTTHLDKECSLNRLSKLWMILQKFIDLLCQRSLAPRCSLVSGAHDRLELVRYSLPGSLLRSPATLFHRRWLVGMVWGQVSLDRAPTAHS